MADLASFLRQFGERVRSARAMASRPGLSPGWAEVQRKSQALGPMEARPAGGVPPAPGYNMRPGRERVEDLQKNYGGAPFPPVPPEVLERVIAAAAAARPPRPPEPITPPAWGPAWSPAPLSLPARPAAAQAAHAPDPYAGPSFGSGFLGAAVRGVGRPVGNGAADIERALGEAALRSAEMARAGQQQARAGVTLPPGEQAAIAALMAARRGGADLDRASAERQRVEGLNSYLAQMQATGFPRGADGGLLRNQAELDAHYKAQMDPSRLAAVAALQASAPPLPNGRPRTGYASIRSADGSGPFVMPAQRPVGSGAAYVGLAGPPTPYAPQDPVPTDDGYVMTTMGLRRRV
jgi:hypothetical protein